MEKRSIAFGEYVTGEHGWTLCSCILTKAQQVQLFISVPGRFAPLDASTGLTDGQPYYENAALDVRLECSEGDREHRTVLIGEFVNYVDGQRLDIIHPDYPNSYLTGRIQAFPEYNDLAHCAVQLSVVCDPWLYNAEETEVPLQATSTEKTVNLLNSGRLAVVPLVTVAGEATLSYNGNTWSLSKGEYLLPDLCLTPGAHLLTYTATDTLIFTYREAVLAV